MEQGELLMAQSVEPPKPLILIATATLQNFAGLAMKLQYGFRVQYTTTLHNQSALLRQLQSGFAVVLLDQEIGASKMSDVRMLTSDSKSRGAPFLEIATVSAMPVLHQWTSGIIYPRDEGVLETVMSHIRHLPTTRHSHVS